MATIDCEISDKCDKNLPSDSKNQHKSFNSDTKNGNIVINVKNSESCQSDNSQTDSNSAPKTVKHENGQVVNDKEDMGTENDSSKISKDLLAIPMSKHGHRMSFMEEESAKEKLRLTLLKQCSAILKQGDQWYTKESLHRTFQDQDLLQRIFRLFDTDNQERLVQADWFEFLKQRLTEEKEIQLVEQVESVAYVLCGNDDISLDAFTQILSNKVVTKILFRVLDTDGDGYITADEVMEFITTVSSNRPRMGLDKSSVDRLEQLFRKTVGDQKEITKEQFRKIMEFKNPLFTERVFQIFDEDDSGAISLQEFIAAVHRYAGQTPEDKIRFLFKVYDFDNDGLLQHRELEHVMRACMDENGMQFSKSQVFDLTEAMFEDADTQRRGAITYEAFRRMLDTHGGLLENITISIDRWLVPPKVDSKPSSLLQRLRRLKPYQLSLPYMKNNYVFLAYLAVFFMVNIVLFITRCIEYGAENGFTILARGCGQCLNFNCSWVLVLMLRLCITQLRVRGFGSALPLDHHIYLHKLTGLLIFLFSVLHTVMHLCNFCILVVNDPVLNREKYSLYQWLLTSAPGRYGLVGGWANPTGLALVAVLLVLFVCSQPFVRRGGRFKIFYWTHLLYVPFWGLLILHCPNFLKWFIIPGAIYITERILRIVWVMSERSKTYISAGILLPSRVTHLVIKRPPHLEFHAGDYVFVNIPSIAFYEWHPFTISSAPELEGYLWLHIRGVGEWTNRLYSRFEQEQARLHGLPSHPLLMDAAHEKLARTSSNQSKKGNMSKGFGSFKKSKKVSIDLTPQKITGSEQPYNPHFGELTPSPTKMSPEALSPQRLLEKSRSMPDVKNKHKAIVHEFLRSESEHTFGRTSPGSQLQLAAHAHASPQHKELEHRFRYMRTKPPIIAFKTPSFEDWERRRSNDSIITQARRRLSKSISPDKDPESPRDKTSLEMKEHHEGFNPEAMMANLPVGKPLEIYIDGPYGAASSHIFQAEHAALIAAGIGVTPFASILQGIMFRYWQARSECPKCHHTWTPRLPSYNMRLRKVDFFWINREQRSFEWFVSLLSELEIEQAELERDSERFLEMHMYITSALQRNDMKAVGLQLALDMLHEKEKRDLITGLKTRTNAGRPNWDKVFKKLEDQNKGPVTVFYCGPPQLGRTLKLKCNQYGFKFRKEVF